MHIVDTVWNQPEGCVTILLDNVDGLSLQNILEQTDFLNAKMIKEITGGALSALRHYYYHTKRAFLGLSPSSLLYSFKSGQFVLTLGLQTKLRFVSAFKSERPQDDALVHFRSLRKKFWLDLFGLGWIILYCIFGLALEELSPVLGFSLQNLYKADFFESLPEKTREYCCLFHFFQDIVLQLPSQPDSAYLCTYSISAETIPVAQRIINKLDKSLKDFLCNLTHLDRKNPRDFSDVLSHSYAQQSQEVAKQPFASKSDPSLYEFVKALRYAKLKSLTPLGGILFDSLSQSIQQLYPNEQISINPDQFQLRIKVLSRELGIERDSLYQYFHPRLAIS